MRAEANKNQAAIAQEGVASRRGPRTTADGRLVEPYDAEQAVDLLASFGFPAEEARTSLANPTLKKGVIEEAAKDMIKRGIPIAPISCSLIDGAFDETGDWIDALKIEKAGRLELWLVQRNKREADQNRRSEEKYHNLQ
jgi:hypothetical protein